MSDCKHEVVVRCHHLRKREWCADCLLLILRQVDWGQSARKNDVLSAMIAALETKPTEKVQEESDAD